MDFNCFPQENYDYICFFTIIAIGLFAWTQLIFDLSMGYGKHIEINRKKLLMPASLAWFIFEFPNIFWSIYWIINGKYNKNFANLSIFLIFLVHYIQRDLIYPLRIHKFSKKVPLEITSSAFFYCIFNGYYQSSSLLNNCKYDFEFSKINILIGWTIFLIGFYINIKSDSILLGLKEKNLKKIGFQERNIQKDNRIYSLPNEFLFKYVVSANYFGETIEWLGFFIAGYNVNGFVFFLSTINILLPKALMQKKWYQSNFKDFPKDRKALIPFLI